MSELEHYQDLDDHPFTGKRVLRSTIRARIKDIEHIRHFFDGSEGYHQVKDLTIGKTYEIYAVEGFGDVADALFKNDKGKETRVMIDWFEDVDGGA